MKGEKRTVTEREEKGNGGKEKEENIKTGVREKSWARSEEKRGKGERE